MTAELMQIPLEGAATSLLGDRLRVRLPAGARPIARHVGGLMGMDISPLREQLVPLQVGQARMMVHATEAFVRLDGPGAVEDVAELYIEGLDGAYGGPWRSWRLGREGAEVALLVPGTLAQQRGDIVTADALVTHPDGLMTRVMFLTDAGTVAAVKEAIIAFARRIATTLEPGPRQLVVGPHEALIGPAPQAPALRIEVPAGYTLTRDQGPDFAVHNLHALTAPHELGCSVSLYLGRHPRLRGNPDAPGVARRVAAGPAGEVAWSIRREGTWTSAEALFGLEAGDPLRVHAFVEAPRAEIVEAAVAAVASARLVR